MSERAGAAPRAVLRLAGGVRRNRLIEPIVAARPQFVLVSAYSGYGKTVLAAQIAASERYAHVIWVRNMGDSGSLRDALARVLDGLTPGAPESGAESLSDFSLACGRELTSLGDEDDLLVVLDDAPWIADADAREALEEVFSEAPPGTTIIATTRSVIDPRELSPSTWLITADELRLSEDEIRETWRIHSGRPLSESQAEEVGVATRGHAALVSLMARDAAFARTDHTRIQSTSSITSLLRKLIRTQLTAVEQDVLDYASILGEGGIDVLERCVGCRVSVSITRIAEAIPLVAVAELAGGTRFAVHALVGQVCESVQGLASRDPDGLRRVCDELAALGAPARALEVALGSELPDLIAECLRTHGSSLLKSPSWTLACDALSGLSPAAVAGDPALMLVGAEAGWARGEKDDAIRQASLARRLAELAADERLETEARALLARFRFIVGDLAGTVEEAQPILDGKLTAPPSVLADVLHAALPVLALLGDATGLGTALEAAHELLKGPTISSSRQAAVQQSLGLVAAVADGDLPESWRWLSRCVAQQNVRLSQRAANLVNLAWLAVELGDHDHARSALCETNLLIASDPNPMDRALSRATESVIDAFQQDASRLAELEDLLIRTAEEESEAFTLVTACTSAALVSTTFGDPVGAVRIAQRGIAAASEIGSPVLLWLAELVHAQATLALGENERPRSTAERILPQAARIGAMGHVLHARLILATIEYRAGNLSQAVEHLSAVNEHIIDKSPVLVVVSYLRAFPDVLGPLALAMGIDAIPTRVLALLPSEHGRVCLEKAGAVLTPVEVGQLADRMRIETERAAEPAAPVDDGGVCRVRLLGGLEVEAPHGPVTPRDWGKRKARLLFMMLVAKQGTEVNRAELIDYLWPDFDEERGVSNFYVIWSAMKRALSPGGVGDTRSPYFENTNGVCRIVPGRVLTDLDEFEEARGSAREARAANDRTAEIAALARAVRVYRGDVLPGDIYDDWFGGIRQRFRQEYQECVLRLSELLLAEGRPLEALPIVVDACARDPLREDLYQTRMRLEIATGQRAAAVETYLACRTRLVDDLGVDPSRETVELYEQVLGMDESDGWSETPR